MGHQESIGLRNPIGPDTELACRFVYDSSSQLMGHHCTGHYGHSGFGRRKASSSIRIEIVGTRRD